MNKSDKIKVGHLYPEAYKFKKGYYVYIGSAMNSLIPRIKRHLSEEKKLHWHVDYLLKSENSVVREVLFNISEEKIECDLAEIISKEGEEIKDFGCSDCNCNSHLIYFKRKKDSVKSIEKAYNQIDMEFHDLKYFKKNFL
ncbi:DUF123 domain-containing protein [uncultured Methanobrevibacter sp.]|uniref:GIY-YIG nuclease family protein n=1 Tax=uncultured Methanobrevibacter sp. TaxID=253161 RepID=UPI00261BC183